MDWSNVILFASIFVIMYFFIFVPQRRQAKERAAMLEAIARGDTIVTAGGIIAKVIRVYKDSDECEVEIADNVRIKLLRSTVAELRRKTVIVEKS